MLNISNACCGSLSCLIKFMADSCEMNLGFLRASTRAFEFYAGESDTEATSDNCRGEIHGNEYGVDEEVENR